MVCKCSCTSYYGVRYCLSNGNCDWRAVLHVCKQLYTAVECCSYSCIAHQAIRLLSKSIAVKPVKESSLEVLPRVNGSLQGSLNPSLSLRSFNSLTLIFQLYIQHCADRCRSGSDSGHGGVHAVFYIVFYPLQGWLSVYHRFQLYSCTRGTSL